MNINEMRKSLINLKIHLDDIDDWARQARNMLHDIEDNLFDIEDKQFCDKKFFQKYGITGSVKYLEEAATCRII